MKESLGLVVPVYDRIGIDGPYLGDIVWNELEKERHFDIVDIAPLIADIISVHSKGGSISRFFEDRLHQNPNPE